MSATATEVKRQHTQADTDLVRAIVSALNRHGSFTNDFGSIGTGASADASVDVSAEHGSDEPLEAGDEVLVTIEDDLTDGLVLVSAEVTSEDTIRVTLLNTTGGSVDPGEITFFFYAPLTLTVL